MVSEFAGNLPILGAGQSKIRSTPQAIVSFVRSLDENGTFEPESTFLNGGQVQAIAGRGNICSAEDLVDMVVDALLPQLDRMMTRTMEDIARKAGMDIPFDLPSELRR